MDRVRLRLPLLVIVGLGFAWTVIYALRIKQYFVQPDEMPWNFATVGRGHDKEWWRTFVRVLRDQGFKGTISIEYEDPFVPVEESVLESARLLSSVLAS